MKKKYTLLATGFNITYIKCGLTWQDMTDIRGRLKTMGCICMSIEEKDGAGVRVIIQKGDTNRLKTWEQLLIFCACLPAGIAVWILTKLIK